jgi:AraC-like DNA-binding protein
MVFRSYFPKPPLSNFVEQFWFYDGFSPRSHRKERLMPDGSVELVINLREDESRFYDRDDLNQCHRLSGNILCGPHSRFFVIDTEEQDSVLGVHFKPGGAFPFFPLPADELQNQHVSLEDLWGQEARLIRERILAAPTAQAKLFAMEACLLERLVKPLEHHRSVSFALSAFAGAERTRTVTEVSERIGLSSRRFIQLFRDQVGLTPKLFCRVRRFQRVLSLLNHGNQIDWVEVAASCGYFDQAHFIHDFKDFSGINPTTYAALKTEHMNHVPIPEPATPAVR